jgi:magnesium and cobalt transporter
MSATSRPSVFDRIRNRFRGRTEPTLRESIAELVQEAADAPINGDIAPELDRQERALIANVLRLRGKQADDVMIPRPDIVAMRADITFDEALAQFRAEGHSRLPVYRESLDDIVGMVHVKDVFGYVGRAEEFALEKILRRPLMVAPQIPVLDLLLQMRQAHMHLALVVDEYGGIDGLVTIEDLVEEIVGDISDEHDEAEIPMWTERTDGTIDVDARLPIDDFEHRLGPVLTEDEREADIDTVGGLVMTLAGRVPARSEVIPHSSGVEFRVIDADVRRVRRLRIRRPAAAANAQ